jgi:hypothetical protein
LTIEAKGEKNVMHAEEKVIEHQIVETKEKRENIMKEEEGDMRRIMIRKTTGITDLEGMARIRI